MKLIFLMRKKKKKIHNPNTKKTKKHNSILVKVCSETIVSFIQKHGRKVSERDSPLETKIYTHVSVLPTILRKFTALYLRPVERFCT